MKASRPGVARGFRLLCSVFGLMMICTVGRFTNASSHFIIVKSEAVDRSNYINEQLLTTNRVINK